MREPEASLAPVPSERPLLREAVTADRDGLLGLWLDLVSHHRRLDPDMPLPQGLRESLGRELDRALASPHARVWVAEVEGELVAFLQAELDPAPSTSSPRPPRSAWIHELFVAPECRRRGIGLELVARADAFFEERGVERPAVRVVSANREALRFWNRAGFRERARVLERVSPRASSAS